KIGAIFARARGRRFETRRDLRKQRDCSDFPAKKNFSTVAHRDCPHHVDDWTGRAKALRRTVVRKPRER
ncbi:MAG: hypothetical protein ACK56I_23730, partial [bacterium]